MSEVFVNEIKEFNLTYLVMAQRFIREDQEVAMMRLNLDLDAAEMIKDLSAKQMALLSSSNQLLCKMAFNDCDKIKKVLNNTRDLGLTETHVAMILSGTAPSTINELN